MRSGPWKKFLSHGHVPARSEHCSATQPPACSRWRGGAGRAGPTEPRGCCGGERARWTTGKPSYRPGGATAVAVRRRSR
jgi:hypothetical protein